MCLWSDVLERWRVLFSASNVCAVFPLLPPNLNIIIFMFISFRLKRCFIISRTCWGAASCSNSNGLSSVCRGTAGGGRRGRRGTDGERRRGTAHCWDGPPHVGRPRQAGGRHRGIVRVQGRLGLRERVLWSEADMEHVSTHQVLFPRCVTAGGNSDSTNPKETTHTVCCCRFWCSYNSLSSYSHAGS